jgi:pimeloyl-ACP methyl ester carboxylesterase/DNA-binding CsgD family transcriptional regulator
VGDGPDVLVVIPPLAQNIEKMWEQPSFWRPIRRLATSVKFVHYDKLGTGLSDPIVDSASLEQRVDELTAVLDGVGAKRAWLLGLSEGGIVAVSAAATIPERVAGTILVNTTSGRGARPESRHGPVRSMSDTIAYFGAVADRWATRDSLVLADFAPSLRFVPGIEAWMESYERASASPAMIHALLGSSLALDATELLPRVRCPTLVVHHTRDRVIPISHGRALAERITGARFVEIDGDDHFAWVSPAVDELIDEVLVHIGATRTVAGNARGLTPWSTLTAAERRIARLAQRGLTNSEIAAAAGSSVRTVETQLTRIYAKLAVRSRTELAIRSEQ